tara:strand:+ start:498 stop:647 length:150 start_codon:yes stop_codon:yes gene_type:complete
MDMKETNEEQVMRRLYTQIFNGEQIFAFFNDGEQEEGWVLANPQDVYKD